MTDMKPEVKDNLIVARVRFWADCHPRTGWYLSFFLTLNYLLDLVSAL